MGSLQWLCMIGRADIQYAVCSLSRFSAAPRVKQLKYVIKVYSYLKEFPEKWITVDHCNLLLFTDPAEPNPAMKDLYPDAIEELDKNFPKGLGKPLQTAVFFDSDHGHDQLTKKSCTGLVVYVGRTPVMWSSKRQTSIQSSSYGAEFMAGRSACEEAILIRYMLLCLGCRL